LYSIHIIFINGAIRGFGTLKFFKSHEERKLDNLIWVLCFTGKPDSAWYPGDQYTDIAGADTYSKSNDRQVPMYTKVKDIVSTRVPITYHECGISPRS